MFTFISPEETMYTQLSTVHLLLDLRAKKQYKKTRLQKLGFSECEIIELLKGSIAEGITYKNCCKCKLIKHLSRFEYRSRTCKKCRNTEKDKK